MKVFLLLAAVLASAAFTCRPDARANGRAAEAQPDAGTPPSASSRPQPPAAVRPRVVVLGDSLTAGLGLPRDEAFPSLLQERLDRAGLAYDVVDAGISGDTTAGGLRRLDWSLDGNVRVLVLALGANDGLRGLNVAAMKQNLDAMIQQAQRRGIGVVLCGMEAPPNYGAAYTREFREAFRDLARERRVVFIPFLLDGVAGVTSLNQADGIHPNAAGARKMADTVGGTLVPLLHQSQPTP